MATVKLREFRSIKLSGTGAGTAKVGPVSARELWRPSNVSVSANNPLTGPPTNESQCIIYVGPDTSEANFRDATQSGSTGDSTDKCNADEIPCGWYVWAVWSGGDALAQANLTVTGTKEV